MTADSNNVLLFQNKTEEEEGIDCLFDDVMKRAIEKLDDNVITQAEFNHIQKTMSQSKLMFEIEPKGGDKNNGSTSHSKSVGHQNSQNAQDLTAALDTSQVRKAARKTDHSDLTIITEEVGSSEDLEYSDSSSDELEDESEVRLR